MLDLDNQNVSIESMWTLLWSGYVYLDVGVVSLYPFLVNGYVFGEEELGAGRVLAQSMVGS